MTVRFVARRVVAAVPAVAVLITVTFVLVHLAPGDPVVALGGEHGDPAHHAFVRARFGLDRPWPEQLAVWVGRVLQGDLGASYVHGRPVIHLIAERMLPTFLLLGAALVVSTGLGLALGSLAARRARRPLDLLLRLGAAVGVALPSFWLAQLALLALALGLGWFPVQGLTDARRQLTGLAWALDVLHHLALPAMVLAAAELALTTRLVRTGLLETLEADYVQTARAKGLDERRVHHHALRNALLPVATVVGARVGMFLTGAVLVEVVFAWPGLGRLLVSAVETRDHPVLLGILLVASVTVIAANLVTDLACGWLDPRIRYR
ncbi:MAG TPA: ABC transporter permease [Candidatus Binatia bacterium]|nr:ABC transporter permease [Candidatus Binatia bacterium]